MSSPYLRDYIAFASEQLWPNLIGFCNAREYFDGIGNVILLHTSDPKRSAGPARRIKDCLEINRRLFPEMAQVCLVETGSTPQEVAETLHSLTNDPQRSFVINATGGTKLIFAGAISLCSLPNVEVHYLEVTQQWFRLRLGSDRRIHSEQLDGQPVDITRIFPLQSLLEFQADRPATCAWSIQDPDPINASGLTEIASSGCNDGWQWQQIMDHRRLKDCLNSQGFLFERFFAALIQNMKCNQVGMNLLLSDAAGVQGIPQTRHEVDVVAAHANRIVFFNLKLTDNQSPIEEITTAKASAEAIGGSAATCVLVRPSWEADPVRDSFINIARSTFRIEVWNQSDMGNLLASIRRILGIPNANESLKEMEAMLLRQHEHNQRLFSSPVSIGYRTSNNEIPYKSPIQEPFIGYIKGMEVYGNGLLSSGRWWYAYDTAFGTQLVFKIPDTLKNRWNHLPAHKTEMIRSALEVAFGDCMIVTNVYTAKSGNLYSALLSPNQQVKGGKKLFLEKLQNCSSDPLFE